MKLTLKLKFIVLFSLFFFLCSSLFAQPDYRAGGRDDSEAASLYVKWAQQAIDEGRMREALAALNRASDFSNVSSDASFLLAVTRLHFISENETRLTVLAALDTAIETGKWVKYDAAQALFLKAQMLSAMREYVKALSCLEQIETQTGTAVTSHTTTEIEMLRLVILRGMAAGGNVSALARFRSRILLAMDIFPRDPRPLRIFFEYARNKKPYSILNPQFSIIGELTESDLNLMELVLRRLPFLLETDPELAWMAAPFIRNLDEARRLISSYRSGGIPNIRNRDFMPHPASAAIALNLGLLGDIEASDELFAGKVSFNNPLPHEIVPDGNPVLDRDIITQVYSLLRSEEGREHFTRKLLSFTGKIISDDDLDGYVDTIVSYNSGIIKNFALDKNQDTEYDLNIVFQSEGVPEKAVSFAAGHKSNARIFWERYPFVKNAVLNDEEYFFRPADFQYAPLKFVELGGSRNISASLYPVIAPLNIDLTRRALVFACSRLTRPSVEFENGMETFLMERGIPLQSEERISGVNGTISVTQFERGLPVIQHIDLDIDGRKETTRRFHRPLFLGSGWDFREYRLLIASSESDWSGDGRHITREVYRQDGSVVYSFDIDGSGEFNYSETGNER